jgi:uroporphyrin-III C-methyltransferase
MSETSRVLKLGVRGDETTLAQVRVIASRLEALLPAIKIEIVPLERSSDLESIKDIKVIAPDSLLSDLKEAVVEGTVDCIIQKAKVPETLDWFYLPWNERTDSNESGKGYALCFRKNDKRFLILRRLFVKSMVFVGAGPGNSELCTIAGKDVLRHCDVCLYDSLVSRELLNWLRPDALALHVGKRAAQQSADRQEICRLLTSHVRAGKRVVRLKGGDPGIFGRLTEEISELDRLKLPYRVIPGVSSLNAATTGTGLTLTRRGISHGFTVKSPIGAEGEEISVELKKKNELPRVFFMAVTRLERIRSELAADGWDDSTPCAMVFDAGGDYQEVVCATLADVDERVSQIKHDRPGILLVGDIASAHFLNQNWGAFEGRKILLTCSEPLMSNIVQLVYDYGGIPIRRPMIHNIGDSEQPIFDAAFFDSASAVEKFAANINIEELKEKRTVAIGDAAKVLKSHGITPTIIAQEEMLEDGVRELAALYVNEYSAHP